jgi:hypothetical protein
LRSIVGPFLSYCLPSAADLPQLPTELPPIGRELTFWAPSKCLRSSYLRVYLVVDLMLLLVIGT